jgi:hypothetical protein
VAFQLRLTGALEAKAHDFFSQEAAVMVFHAKVKVIKKGSNGRPAQKESSAVAELASKPRGVEATVASWIREFNQRKKQGAAEPQSENSGFGKNISEFFGPR